MDEDDDDDAGSWSILGAQWPETATATAKDIAKDTIIAKDTHTHIHTL